MKQSVRDRAMAPEALRSLYAPIRGELDQVEEILGGELSSNFAFVDQLVKHGLRLGGKRLRPALVLLSAKACGALRPDHLVLAAAVEMIHTATLIHDDVLDEATLRRHLDTVNARWDNEASILLGDYLFSRSIGLAASVDDAFACRTIGEAGRKMCEGELRQLESRGNYDLSEADYLDIITAKTAALTSCCCRLGGYYAGATTEIRDMLTRYGRYLGIAFQIVDDLLDLLGDEATAGKSLGTDLVKEKSTLPVIRLLQQVSPPQRTQLVALLSGLNDHRRDALRPWFEHCDALAYAQDKALEYTRLAREELDCLPATPFRDALRGLTEFVVNRQQ